jgi:hypothetical protein
MLHYIKSKRVGERMELQSSIDRGELTGWRNKAVEIHRDNRGEASDESDEEKNGIKEAKVPDRETSLVWSVVSVAKHFRFKGSSDSPFSQPRLQLPFSLYFRISFGADFVRFTLFFGNSCLINRNHILLINCSPTLIVVVQYN